MVVYLSRRLLTMLLTLLAISALVFVIIQLPPGDDLVRRQGLVVEGGGGDVGAEQAGQPGILPPRTRNA